MTTVVRSLLTDALVRIDATESTRVHNDTDLRKAGKRAQTVKQALEELGPFYVKLGQMLSTRPDLVSPVMMAELEKLHDEVSPAPFSVFEPVLKEDLGVSWRTYFPDVDIDRPLGSASLAQVYRVTLPGGEPAVVKIQRPGIGAVILRDMKQLRRIARWVSRLFPRLNAVLDIDAMLAVIFEGMRPELDFTLEANNMRDARKYVKRFKHVDVPRVIHATPRVLVQTLAPGCSIRDADKDNFTAKERKDIGRDLLRLMYQGYFVEHMFHADPHPGNVFVQPGGKATLLDWGMVGRIDRNLGLNLILCLLSIAQNDAIATAKSWIEMGHATPWADINGFASDLSMLVPRVATASLEQLNFGVTLSTLLMYASRRGIHTSAHISLLGKSFANVEGSVRYLAPELSMVDVFTDALSDIMADLIADNASREQVGRTAIDLMMGSTTILEQLRVLLRDLTSREMTFRVGVVVGTKHSGLQVQDRKKLGNILLGAAAILVWNRLQPGRDRPRFPSS
ncbi:AarF/ABC1/UbiB kinase family protein [Nocardia terpenica]|uniref:ABC1 kinase family protein n=1 Tax=Nocardia terpenica TaxID=455432 RepID=UPI002FE275AC